MVIVSGGPMEAREERGDCGWLDIASEVAGDSGLW